MGLGNSVNNKSKTYYGRIITFFVAGSLFGFGFSYLFMLRLISFTYFCHNPSNFQNVAIENNSQNENTGYNTRAPIVFLERNKTVRILCWVLTNPKNHKTRTISIQETWGKKCTKLIFVSSEADDTVPVITLPNIKEGYDHLWTKTKAAFKHIYEKHIDDADWFLKADDDTYVIFENLQNFLQNKNSTIPIFYGCNFIYNKIEYMSGGAGYVVSKEALKKFAPWLLLNESYCDKTYINNGGMAEDLQLGICMKRFGVKAGESRDNLGLIRFHPFTPSDHLKQKYPDWYFKYIKHPPVKGLSDTAITFHYTKPEQMLQLEYMIYSLNSQRNYTAIY